MANAVCSPRFSFSRDHIKQQYKDGEGEEDGEEKTERLDGSLLLSLGVGSPPTSDFDFCVTGEGCDPKTSSADELFSDGKILPLPIIQIQPSRLTWTNPSSKDPVLVVPDPIPTRSTLITSSSPPPPSLSLPTVVVKDEGRERSKTSFWKFGRSTSLCGRRISGGRTASASVICSSVVLLNRSKSTGSNFSSIQMQQQLRMACSNKSRGRVSRTCSSSSSISPPPPPLPPPPSSYYYGHYGNHGVKISPVLNVPYNFVPKGSCRGNGFFGFGHLLCGGKEKEKNSRKKKPDQN